jgi:uncharacterized membrane protein
MRELSRLDHVIDHVLDHATLLCALGSGVIAGFSVCVMKALGSLPPPQGIAAMQSINVVVINRWFLAVFMGTALVCVLVSVASVVSWRVPTSPCLLAGSLLYLVGSVLVTMRFNVPRNDALAAATPHGTEAARLWLDYLSTRTSWNHVRMAASFAAAAMFSVALCLRS